MTAAPGEMAHLNKALDDGLRELGWVEGRNIVFERRFAEGKQERLPELAAQLVRLNVDVIVSGANPVLAALKQATTTIPVVMVTSRDPVGSGFIASLSRPGGNVTGITGDPTPEVQAKRLQILKQLVPRATRVVLLWNPLPPGAETYRREADDAARRLGLRLFAVEARTRAEFEGAFSAMARERAEAVVVLPDPMFYTARKQVAELTAKYRLPAVQGTRDEAEAGALGPIISSSSY